MVPASKTLDIADLHHRLKNVDAGGWLVVVFQTVAAVEVGIPILASLLPHGSTMCGRTAILPNRRKVTLVAADNPPFNASYDVVFVGWSGGMSAWRSRAARVF